MTQVSRKIVLSVVVMALMVAALPILNASAMGNTEPPPPGTELTTDRLESIWEHQLAFYERIGEGLARADTFVERVQSLIERAEANGNDVSSVQAALDAFSDALKDVKPIYESAKGLVNSHQGFDSSGNVTDAAEAKETVKAMSAKLKEIKETLGGTGQALRESIKEFREANPRPERTPPTE